MRTLAAQAFAKARDEDPGTLGYEWFFDSAGSAPAMDIYADAAAMAAYMQNCGAIMAQILDIADGRTVTFGDLADGLRARLKPGLAAEHFGRRLHGVA